MDLREKMKTEKLYYSNDTDLLKEQSMYMEILYDFNMTRPSETEKRVSLLKELFAEYGENSVIGAGSVVTKDIPANVVALGSPCRVIREINEEDMKFYHHGKEIDIE